MRKYAFDLGLHMGVASSDGQMVESTTVGLGCAANCRRCRVLQGNRFARLRVYLDALPWHEIDGVAYEHLTFMPKKNGFKAAHLWGAWMGLLQAACHAHNITPIEVPVQTWKKALGVPSADKSRYIDRVNHLTGLTLSAKEEDQAAAIGVGLAAFPHDWHLSIHR